MGKHDSAILTAAPIIAFAPNCGIALVTKQNNAYTVLKNLSHIFTNQSSCMVDSYLTTVSKADCTKQMEILNNHKWIKQQPITTKRKKWRDRNDNECTYCE